MDCERVRAEAIAESYLLGRLTDPDRDAFESHYFECERCFEELGALQSVRSVLQRSEAPPLVSALRRRPSTLVWAAAAALVLATGTGLWLLDQSRRSHARAAAEVRETPPSRVAPNTPDARAALEALARVDPPPYLTITWRSSDKDRFAAAMDRYARGDYARAADELRAIAGADPSAPRVHFYLGASELMAGRPEAAIDALQRVTAATSSAFAEHAHLLLAKAWLTSHRAPEARRELQACAALGGAHASEARVLLERLNAIAPP